MLTKLVTIVAAAALALALATAAPAAHAADPFAALPAPVEVDATELPDATVAGVRLDPSVLVPRTPRPAGEPGTVIDGERSYARAGDRLTVTAGERLTATLLRVTRRGRPMRRLAESELARGRRARFAVPAQPGLLHELRLRTRDGRQTRRFVYVPHGSTATLALDRPAWRPGEQVGGELFVRGDVPLTTGVCSTLERREASGAWTVLPGAPCGALAVRIVPDHVERTGFALAPDLPPGRYRLRRELTSEPTGERITATAELDVR